MFRRTIDRMRGTGAVLTPVHTTTNQIETMGPGEKLTYQLAKVYWTGLGGFAIVERNSGHPGHGKKFVVYTDKSIDGKPGGRPGRLWASNKAKDVALWVVDKGGVLLR